MNRPLKFRAWNPQGDMLAPWELGDGTTNEKLIREENWPIMQFTGLLDKNGKEIYEGDILRIPSFMEESGYELYEVKWPKIFTHFSGSLRDEEVVGDIYSNPELLSNSL